jgi:hypothetical protein
MSDYDVSHKCHHSQASKCGGASQHMIFSPEAPDIPFNTKLLRIFPATSAPCAPLTKRREKPSFPSRTAAQQAQFQQAPFPWIGAAAQRRREPFPFHFVPLQWREFPLQRQRWQPANLRFTPDGCMQRPGHYCSSCSCYQFSVLPTRQSVMDACTSISRDRRNLWTSNTMVCNAMWQRVHNSPRAFPARLKICASA